MLKILVPASEANRNGAPSGGWPRVAWFIGICAAIGLLIYGFAFDFAAPETAPTRGAIPFAIAVVLVAIHFAQRRPLSKPRVDLLYYSLAAMSAAILYVDNAEQRATIRDELDRQRLELLSATAKRQELEVARLRATFERAAAELAQAETQLPSLREELAAAKAAAKTALDSMEKSEEERCAQVWRECPPVVPRLERDSRTRGAVRILDPFSCEARTKSCVLGSRGAEASSLRSLLGTSKLDDLVDIDVSQLPEAPLRTARGAVTLRRSVDLLISRARQMKTLRARRESAESSLQAASSDLEEQRKELRPIEAQVQLQRGGSATPKGRSSAFDLEISFLAKFVWGWVLIVLLGLKLAREPFVLLYREGRHVDA